MIDPKWIGHELPASVLDLERGRLAFFAKAIGETDPVYSDETAARAAGHPDVPAPPTFLFAAELDSGALTALLGDLGVSIGKILHGEQSFTYRRMVHAGERITVRSRISDVYAKKNGALEFIVKDSVASDRSGETVAELRSVIVVRN
jgi:acyl dehydratase